MKKVIYLLLLLILASCNGGRKSNNSTEATENVKLHYAKGFSIAHAKNYTVITVYNPWKNWEVYDKYYLVKDTTLNIPSDGHKVLIPLKSMMVNSATHIGFMDILGELDKIKGVSNSKFLYNPYILKGVKEGHIKDLGDAFNLDIESLLMLHPQAVMTTAYNAEDENSRRMKQTGLTLLYNVEWQEPSILGRAEWIKFVGAFFDKEQKADSIFNAVEKSYLDIKAQVAKQKNSPTIFSGQDYRGTWSMAGGRSYTAQLFKDAGAIYKFANDTTAVIAGNIEEALMDFNQADIWIGVQVSTLNELAMTDSKYKLFKAFKTGRVFSINNRMNALGGNDYWESGVVRPDLMLKDMIQICHPGFFPGYSLTYYKQLH